MSDVFISYSRRDIDFVRHLFDQLTARDREAWADWQDIPSTADWLAEIYRGIEAANTFLFVINLDACEGFQFNSRFDWFTQDQLHQIWARTIQFVVRWIPGRERILYRVKAKLVIRVNTSLIEDRYAG